MLKDISLHCETGNIYGFVGHNGSGKTVLFKCICGFLKCGRGEIRMDGKGMGKEVDMLTYAGIIMEEPGFLRKWSAYRNLEFLIPYGTRETSNTYIPSRKSRAGTEAAQAGRKVFARHEAEAGHCAGDYGKS